MFFNKKYFKKNILYHNTKTTEINQHQFRGQSK